MEFPWVLHLLVRVVVVGAEWEEEDWESLSFRSSSVYSSLNKIIITITTTTTIIINNNIILLSINKGLLLPIRIPCRSPAQPRLQQR